MRLSPATVQLLNSGSPIPASPQVIISACLHGEPVRYDGSHKSLHDTLTILTKHLDLKPICPEAGAGLGVPRPPVQLVATDTGELRALGRDDPRLDVTGPLLAFAGQSLLSLGDIPVGYIVKSRSPSCGYQTTPIYRADGQVQGPGSGLHIDYFHRLRPWLQIADEQQLGTTTGCEAFISRCLILEDVRRHVSIGLAGELHDHYRELIIGMGATTQRQLEAALSAEEMVTYWQLFGRGLQSLALS